MRVSSDVLKSAFKRIDAIYRKKIYSTNARYLEMYMSKEKIKDKKEYFLNIVSFNSEETIVEKIYIPHDTIENNIDPIVKMSVGIYGETLIDIINKNEKAFDIVFDDRTSDLVINSDGEYRLAYVEGSFHDKGSLVSTENAMFSFLINREIFIEMISALSDFQDKNNMNIHTKGINFSITNDNINLLNATSTNGIIFAKASTMISSYENGIFCAKIVSKSLLPYLKQIDKETEILVNICQNGMIISEELPNQRASASFLFVPFTKGYTDILSSIDHQEKENYISIGVSRDDMLTAIERSICNEKIELLFHSDFIDVHFHEPGFISSVKVHCGNLHEKLSGKRTILSPVYLYKILKNISSDDGNNEIAMSNREMKINTILYPFNKEVELFVSYHIPQMR